MSSVPVKVVDAKGNIHWLCGLRKHRTDGPAVEWANGTKEWYQDDLRHRIDGAAIEYANGRKEWWQNGQRHRTDGPAVEDDKDWGSDGKAWFINGEELTEAEFLASAQPVVELTVADVEKLLGKRVKIIK